MKSIKNFLNTVLEIFVETRRLKAEHFARKYSKL